MMVSGAGTKSYFHQNHLYSVAAMTNSVGAVVERYRYDAYGKRTVTNAAGTTIAASTIGQQRGFTGYYEDAETGLYYARARMYSAGLGRFVGRDPLGYVGVNADESDGYNLYQAYFAPNQLDSTGLHGEYPNKIGACCCCCAESLTLENIQRTYKYFVGGSVLFGDSFDVRLGMSYKTAEKPGSDCKFTWTETTSGSRPGSMPDGERVGDPRFARGFRWHRMYPRPCPGYLSFLEYDAPGINPAGTGTRILKIVVKLESTCNSCTHRSRTLTIVQTLVTKRNRPQIDESHFVYTYEQ